MLDRLYSLYVTVIGTIKGYGDYFWVDVVEKIDEMGDTVGHHSLGYVRSSLICMGFMRHATLR